VEARANKDLDVLAHAFSVIVILYCGQGHLMTSVSSPTTMNNDTEAYLHASALVGIQILPCSLTSSPFAPPHLRRDFLYFRVMSCGFL
jgi:hypothetical protein